MEQTKIKPKAKLIVESGNVFNLIGICSKALKKAGMHDEAKEMTEKVFSSNSYDEALAIMGDYCDIV